MSMNMGNAPDIPVDRLFELRGQYCAVQFGSRKLLAHGSDWVAIRKTLRDQDVSARSYYCYPVPLDLELRDNPECGKLATDHSAASLAAHRAAASR